MFRRGLRGRRFQAPIRNRAAITEDGRLIHSNRDWWLLVAFTALALVLIGQLVHLQVFAAPGLSEKARNQRSYEIEIRAQRGSIYDRNGNVLAMSVDATTIYANPQQVKNPQATADILAEILGGDPDYYCQQLKKDLSFVYIKKQVDVAVAQQLKDLEDDLIEELKEKKKNGETSLTIADMPLTGIYYLKDTKRVYPYGSIGAQVIGGVNIDNKGAYGLELLYDSVLRGVDGTLYTEYALQIDDRPLSGQPIPGSEKKEVAPIRGNDIIISLDIELQKYVELELARAGEERETENGNVLILDGATGEIYATASLPLLDRDNLTSEAIQKGVLTLKSISLAYEPGSTFKLVTAAAVLDERAFDPEQQLLVPDKRDYEQDSFRDAVRHPDMMMNLRDIITMSSNVGISMVKDNLSDAVYYSYLQRYGFGRATHIDFPGEAIGSLSPYHKWYDIDSGTISFGQGLTVTSLEMASFYGAIANNGVKYQPHFLIGYPQSKENPLPSYKSEQIMRPDTADLLTSMLISAVAEGTGHSARINGYEVAGKTGTAQKANPEASGYLSDDYIVSFVGFLANTDSKLVCITMMDNPIGAYGNSPTGPLFASLMWYAANRYMIAPTT